MEQETHYLQQAILHFQTEYIPHLETLSDLLDEARISHYSSGSGVKRITYDIFPASYYVDDMIRMVSLDRNHKKTSDTGLKDFMSGREYNPAYQFNQYLKRWSEYAEEVMASEGDSPRGVAAAKAKLLMNNLAPRLAQRPATRNNRLGAKLSGTNDSNASKSMDFYELMRSIGHTLQVRKENERTRMDMSAKERRELNYKKALAAASGTDSSTTANVA